MLQLGGFPFFPFSSDQLLPDRRLSAPWRLEQWRHSRHSTPLGIEHIKDLDHASILYHKHRPYTSQVSVSHHLRSCLFQRAWAMLKLLRLVGIFIFR